MTSSTAGNRQLPASSSFFSLLKLYLKISFSLGTLREKFGAGRKGAAGLVYMILLPLAFIPLFSLMVKFSGELCQAATALGLPSIPITVGVLLGQVLVLFFGFPYLMSSLYFAEDLSRLRVLPLPAWQIVGAKLSIVYLVELLFTIPLVMPIFVVFGLNSGASWSYWPIAAVCYLLLPSLPLAVSLLTLAAFMRLTNVTVKRDALRVAGGLVLFACVFILQLLVTRLTGTGDAQAQQFLAVYQNTLAAAGKGIPSVSWAAMALTAPLLGTRAAFLALFSCLSLVSLAVTVLAAQKLFMGGIIGAREVSVHSAAIEPHPAEGLRPERNHGLMFSLLLREHRILTRTPAFLLTALLNLAVLPIILVVGVLGGSVSQLGNLPVSLSILPTGLVVFGVVALGCFVVAMDQVPATAFSREGRQFWISKAIPVPPTLQVRAKLWYGVLYALVQTLILIALAYFFLRVPAGGLAVIAILEILLIWPITGICLLVDLLNPHLDWNEPQHAMKGNLNSMVGALLSILFLLLPATVDYFLLRSAYSISWSYLVTGVIAITGGAIIQKIVETLAEARYRDIEV